MDERTYTVVQLITRMNIGGPARVVVELAKGLADIKHDLPDITHDRETGRKYNVIVAAGTPPAEEGELSDPQVPIVRLPLVRRIDPYTDIRSLIALRRILAGENPRLYHNNSQRTNPQYSGHRRTDPYHAHSSPALHVDLINTHMAKAGALGRLAALSIRGQLPPDNLDQATAIHTDIPPRSNPRRPITVHTFHGHVLDGYFNRSVSKAFTLIERQLARHTDALVAISNEVRDELLSLGIGRPDQWHVIPLGLDLDPYLSIPLPDISTPSSKAESKLLNELSIPPSATVLAMVARLVPIKDHSTALKALANPIMDDTHLLVVGDGELRDALEKESQALGIAQRIYFLGWRQDIPDILAASDMVILTSINEGTPAALIDAAAAARPVVATDVGGIPSVVVQDETGLLVAPGKPDLLAEAIHKLAASPSTRLAMGTAARSRAAALYSSSNFISQTAKLYDQLLSKRDSGL